MAVALGRDDELLAALQELQLLLVDPGLVGVGQDELRRSVRAGDEPHVEAGLHAVRRLDGDRSAVRQPLHAEDVLVTGGRLVHPGRPAAADLDDPDAHERVGVPGLRIALADDLRDGGRELRERDDVHHGLVRAQERDRGGVVGPPEAGDAVVEDLLPVEPGEVAVENRGAPVRGEARLGLRAEVANVEVVRPDEGDLAAVRRKAGDGLGLGRARQALEARVREIQDEEIAGDGVDGDSPRRVEGFGPRERLGRVHRSHECLEARQGRRAIHGRLALACPGLHALDRALRGGLRLVQHQQIAAGRPRHLRRLRSGFALVAVGPRDVTSFRSWARRPVARRSGSRAARRIGFMVTSRKVEQGYATG